MKLVKSALIDLMVEIFTDLLQFNRDRHRKLDEHLVPLAVYVLSLLPPLSYDRLRYPDRRAEVLRLRLGLNTNGQVQTLEEIGRLLGVTREIIRSNQMRALRHLWRMAHLYEDSKLEMLSDMVSGFTGDGSGVTKITYKDRESIECAVMRARAEELGLDPSACELEIRHAWRCQISKLPLTASKQEIALALYAMYLGNSDQVDKLQA